MDSEKKRVQVVAALICRDGEVFATQRGYGDYKDWWEFPGGKVEQGESPEQALAREIKEELAAEISVGEGILQRLNTTTRSFICPWPATGAVSGEGA